MNESEKIETLKEILKIKKQFNRILNIEIKALEKALNNYKK